MFATVDEAIALIPKTRNRDVLSLSYSDNIVCSRYDSTDENCSGGYRIPDEKC